MSSEEYKRSTKIFLERKLTEYSTKIQRLKKRRKIVKILFITFISLSLSCSAVCGTLGTFVVPPIIVPILSSTGALFTIFSVKFNLEGKKEELNKTIEKLNKIKSKLDYVVSCNGGFTEAEYKQIIRELTQ